MIINPVLKAREVVNSFTYQHNEELMDKIFQAYQIDLDYWPFEDDLSGMFWLPEPDWPCIAININHPRTRQNFTKGHELGHFFLGHGKRFCSNIFRNKSLIENHANIFSAELLMPCDRLSELVNKGYTIKQLCDFFMVSNEAMTWRLKALRLFKKADNNENPFRQYLARRLAEKPFRSNFRQSL